MDTLGTAKSFLIDEVSLFSGVVLYTCVHLAAVI